MSTALLESPLFAVLGKDLLNIGKTEQESFICFTSLLRNVLLYLYFTTFLSFSLYLL
jgi:hypothetical protein